MTSDAYAGRIWRERIKPEVFRRYGTKCWLCGHDGATQVDHVISVAEGGTRKIENLRPVHGSAGKQKGPCRTCSRAAGKPVNCNQIRMDRTPERARQILERYTGLKLSVVTPADDDPIAW
jgi:5-methylcytosine-specific restriction endonuclease McrA